MAEQSIWHGAPTDGDYGGSFCTICVFCTGSVRGIADGAPPGPHWCYGLHAALGLLPLISECSSVATRTAAEGSTRSTSQKQICYHKRCCGLRLEKFSTAGRELPIRDIQTSLHTLTCHLALVSLASSPSVKPFVTSAFD